MEPLLSIITITYRDPEGLAATLASLDQAGLDDTTWEHVIVDSSPELHGKVLAGPKKAFLHIRQKPAGIYAAMNEGIRSAQGKYLWFLNGGDRLHSAEGLRKVLAALDAAPSMDLAQGMAELWRDGKFLYPQRPRGGIGPVLGINRVCHQAVIYRRALFDRIGDFSESYRLVSDYEFHLRALAAGARILPVDVPLVRYDMGGQSSNVEAAFGEFRQVHESLAAQGKLPHAWLHGIARRVEHRRIRAMKRLGESAWGPALRMLWWKCRR